MTPEFEKMRSQPLLPLTPVERRIAEAAFAHATPNMRQHTAAQAVFELRGDSGRRATVGEAEDLRAELQRDDGGEFWRATRP